MKVIRTDHVMVNFHSYNKKDAEGFNTQVLICDNFYRFLRISIIFMQTAILAVNLIVMEYRYETQY
jgi:hypothetical protein